MNAASDGPAVGGGPHAEVVDCHVHFWDPRRLTYPWLDDVPALRRPFTADDLAASGSAPTWAIFVEAGRVTQESSAEVEWVRREARRHPWILGVVADARLEDPAQTATALRRYTDDPFIVGVRRNLQDEAAGFTEEADFRAGVRALGEVSLPFDACVREHQLPELTELAAACPRTTIILDHLGKPRSSDPGDASWRRDLCRLAKLDNVVCKLSGLTTEVPQGTSRTCLINVLQEALDAFGPDRCLYGSDWPVMTLATDYEDWLDLVRSALAPYRAVDAEGVLSRNAARIYRLFRAIPPPTITPREPA